MRRPRWLTACLCMALFQALAMAMAASATEPAHSPIPRVDRELLLGFLADNDTMTLIDARSPEEFADQHLPGAINIPFDAVAANAALLPDDRSRPIVVYCRSGKRAGLLQADLRTRGYTNVQVLPREQIFWQANFMVFNCGAAPVENDRVANSESAGTDN